MIEVSPMWDEDHNYNGEWFPLIQVSTHTEEEIQQIMLEDLRRFGTYCRHDFASMSCDPVSLMWEKYESLPPSRLYPHLCEEYPTFHHGSTAWNLCDSE